jgi:hypothetical protein
MGELVSIMDLVANWNVTLHPDRHNTLTALLLFGVGSIAHHPETRRGDQQNSATRKLRSLHRLAS